MYTKNATITNIQIRTCRKKLNKIKKYKYKIIIEKWTKWHKAHGRWQTSEINKQTVKKISGVVQRAYQDYSI